MSRITYTCAYQVAYLLKIITGGDPLPPEMEKFLGVVCQFLGEQVYDVARMAADCPALSVGLERMHRSAPWHPSALGKPDCLRLLPSACALGWRLGDYWSR
jgi:xanthosine utilization system XapX-like protein